LDDKSLELARAQHFLSYAYVQAGEPGKAALRLQNAFNIKKEILGQEHQDTASTV
jgi:hypothetical protein